MATAVSSQTGGAQTMSGPSHPFTCVSCAIAFRSSELQRSHMRSDWHRYNLKRRVASLPPLSSEMFTEKVLNAQATSSAAAAKASYEKICTACQRTYYSENAYINHIGSTKHKQRLHALQSPRQADTETASVMSSTISLGEPLGSVTTEDDDESDRDSTELADQLREASLNSTHPTSESKSQPHQTEDANRPDSAASTAPTTETAQSSQMPVHRCLFCNYDSPNLKLNVMHMTKFHGLFIPEQAYLEDQEGLIKYLQAKVVENYECIYCHKLKGSMHGVQTHMRDKGHCMIAFETEEELIEIGQFYDFRSTYSDDEDEDEDEHETDVQPQKSSKLGARRTSQQTEDGHEQDWETDSDDSVATDEITTVFIDQDYHRLAQHRHHTHSDPRSHKAPDGFHSHAHQHHAAFHSDYELHLPSGRSAGHRSLNRYFRQNLHNYPTAQERLNNLLLDRPTGEEGEEEEEKEAGRGRDRQMVKRGELGMVGVTDQKKKAITAVTKRAQQQAERSQRQYQWGVQKKANNQKHFRDDNFGTHI